MPCPVIVGALHECGVASSNGMGRSPITWQELKSYSELSRMDLSGWEASQVISMSKAYCSMVNEATEYRAIKAPYSPELTDDDIYRRGAKASGDAEKALNIDNY